MELNSGNPPNIEKESLVEVYKQAMANVTDCNCSCNKEKVKGKQEEDFNLNAFLWLGE